MIGSSLTVALSVRAAQHGNLKGIINWIYATIFLGSLFLGVKVIEYKAKWDHHLVPGQHFDYASARAYYDKKAEKKAAAKEKDKDAEKSDKAEKKDQDVEGAHGAPGGSGDSGEAGKVAVTEGKSESKNFTAGQVEIFYCFYFAMTGMHALHMIIGVGLMVWLLIKAYRKEFAANYYSPVENFGLYWHFVDLIWIFLFPLLYLV
ncbi:MAG: cytochrome c oxidase subunit 3 [Verrucomicrobiota bacterium]